MRSWSRSNWRVSPTARIGAPWGLSKVQASIAKYRIRDGTCSLWPCQIRAVVPTWGGQGTLRPGIMRLPAQTRLQHFNCLEVHEVRKLHFLGIPYIFYNGPPSPPAKRHPDSVEPAAHPGRRNDSLNNLMVGRSHQFCRRQESLRVTPGNGSVTDRSHLEFE